MSDGAGVQEQFTLVLARLRHDFPPGFARITLATKLADFPGRLGPEAVDRGDKIRVGHRVRGLLQFPAILGKTRDGGRRFVGNLPAVQSQNARAFGVTAV